jgi:hypothetical protein
MDESLTLKNPKLGEVYYHPAGIEQLFLVINVGNAGVEVTDLLDEEDVTYNLMFINPVIENYYIIRGKRKRKILRDVLRGKYGI